jgi:hypothetical protein
MVVCANARLVRQYYPDFRHLLKNLRGRYIKGMIAAIPYYGAFVVRPCDFRRLGMSEATVADRRCYHQDDLKAEEFFKCLYLGRCAEQFAEALGQGQHDLARCYGALYLMLFPAYCLAYAVLRNELDDAERDLLLSFAFAFAKLWSGEYHNVYTKLSKQRQTQRLRPSGKGEAKGHCRTLFDGDSLDKLVTLTALLARQLFPDRATRFGAFGTIHQEHLHAEIRSHAHSDQRCVPILLGMRRRLDMYLSGYVPRVRPPIPPLVPRGSHSFGKTFMPALVGLPGVFRHVVAPVTT